MYLARCAERMQRKGPHAALLALAIGILAAALLGEVALRINHALSKEPIGATEEERCVRSLYLTLENQSDPVRLSPLHTDYLRYDPLTGLRPKEGTHLGRISASNLPDGTPVTLALHDVIINNISTKNAHDVSAERTTKNRIAVIGDSFTWGSDVMHAYSYPSFLRVIVPDSEVLNYGIQGVGIDVMYLRWKHEALTVHPDAVIFTVLYDDIRRAQPCAYKPRLSVKDGAIVVTNQPPPTMEEFAKQRPPLVESVLLKDLAHWWRYRRGVRATQYEEQFPLFSAMLDEMSATSLARNQTFIVLFIDRENSRPLAAEDNDAVNRSVALLERKHIAFVTASAIFAAERHTPPNFSPPVDHFLPDTNAYLAQGIAGLLRQRGFTVAPAYDVTYDTARKVMVLSERAHPERRMVVTPYDVYVNGTLANNRFFAEPIAPRD